MSNPHDLFTPLLENGYYGLSRFGQTHAVILTGDRAFRTKGYNLFASFGGESAREGEVETPVPPIHYSDRPNTIWFCLPDTRVRSALTLYFFGQLYQTQGVRTSVIDDQGDFVEMKCENEEALYEQAGQLACDFIVNHMRPDWRALPSYDADYGAVVEYSIGELNNDGGE